MIKIAIVDDVQSDIEKMKNLLRQNVNDLYQIFAYQTAESFIDAINHETYDIIFLDIMLNSYTGIQIGQMVNEKHPHTNIIFVSVNPEYFKDVYKVAHSYFLTKDFEKERFADAISKAIAQVKKNFIIIHTKNENQKIYLNEIIFLESNLKHTKLYTTDESVTEYNINLKEIEKMLPEQDFVRTHKSFIVNMCHIKKYDRQTVMVDFNHFIPISRQYLTEAREKLACYLGGVL